MSKARNYILVMLLVAGFVSCAKEGDINSEVVVPDTIYGSFKASYGDTVVFSRKNGVDIVTHNNSMNPLDFKRSDHLFYYKDDKLTIVNFMSQPFTTFKWTQRWQSFEVQGIEWFPFLNSTLTYFTFTRIP